MKRIYTGAPAWADYIYQLVSRFSYALNTLNSFLTDWRFDFLDRHCQCAKCTERRWNK